MKRMAMWMAAGMVAAAAWGARHAVKADGRLSALEANTEEVTPLEWEHVGRILDGEGRAVTGSATLVVRLYGAAEGGEVLWARKAPVVLDADGNFSVRLTDALEAPEDAPARKLTRALAAGPCWIECQIEGHSGAMAPRAAVAAAPYALFADAAEGAREDFDAASSLAVAGTASAGSFSAADTVSDGAVTAGGKLSVDGDAAMAGGLKAGSLEGIGALPAGTIILWYGDAATPPDGWAFCDGSAGTPDLRGRFPVGAGGNYAVGETGGAETVTLTADQLPPHSHGYELRDDKNRDEPSWIGDNHGVWHGDKKVQTDNAGGGKAHENLPPYRALWYIMRTE